MYHGGKNGSGTYQNIINKLPPHNRYIEGFLGSGAILNNKKPALENYGIEINGSVIDRFDYYAFAFILKDSFFTWAQKHDHLFTADTLIYLDPPYPLSSRKQQSPVYEHELTDNDHRKLLELILSMRYRCMIAISTYPNGLYYNMLKDWNVYTFDSQTRKGKAKECLFMNYPEPVKLHDYNFIGKDFTDRQRIKRKLEREIKRLRLLPALEREAILQAINARV